MKKNGLIIISILCIVTLFAQKTLHIFKTDLSVINVIVNSIDSVQFSGSDTVIDIHSTNNSILSIPVSKIDSLTFTDSITNNLPVISTSVISSISYTTAQSGITVLSVGGTSIIEEGICWSTVENPTVENTKITSDVISNSQAVSLAGLPSGSIVYIRAYATNLNGTSYGNQLSFNTLNNTLPVVTTTSAVYNSSLSKATCKANVTSVGSCGSISERGVCWSTSKNPTITDNKYPSGNYAGQYYAFMTNLNINTTYYVRAYATSCAGTAYGNQLTVVTLMGNVTYTMGFDSITYPSQYRMIKIAVDSACYYYNRYTTFSHNIWIAYSSGVPTAEASYHGQVAFGSDPTYMWVGTAMHEFAHYFGSGTTSIWQSKTTTGIWTGPTGAALLLSATGETLKGDTQHFWPYGINYKTEITGLGNSVAQKNGLILHCKLVKAMLVDDCNLPVSW
jgi:hypothetical protein